MSDHIDVPAGDRRKMIDQLLEQASNLYGPRGRCHFRSCYGQADEEFELIASKGDTEVTWRILACSDHLDITEAISARASMNELTGFLSTHVDQDRSIFKESTP